MKKRTSKEAFYQWFFQNCDLGPANQEIKEQLYYKFMTRTGMRLPENFIEISCAECGFETTDPEWFMGSSAKCPECIKKLTEDKL